MNINFFEQDVTQYISSSSQSLPEPFFLTTRETIEEWLQKVKVRNYEIDDDLIIHVKGDVNIMMENLVNIPVQFGHVEGSFNCSNNRLTSLKGSPLSAKNINCSYNKLISLEHCPPELEILRCDNNQIRNLDYLPSTLKSLNCSHNQIKILTNLPIEFNGHLSISHNLLTSLDGSPKVIKGNFLCDNNQLTSLELGPNKIYGTYDCYNNHIQNIDIELWIGKELHCYENPIEDINIHKLQLGIIFMDMNEEFEFDLRSFYQEDENILIIPYQEFKKYKKKQEEMNKLRQSLNDELIKNEIVAQRKI